MQEPPCLLPQLGVGFGEREDVNQTRMVARGLQLCPQPGGCSTSSSRGPWCSQCSRLLKSLAPGTSGPWHELWDHPDPREAVGCPTRCFLYGDALRSSASTSMEADAGTADFSHFPGFKSTKVDVRLQKFHSWDCRPLLPQESSRPLTSPALLHPFPAVRRDVGATSSGLPYNFWGPLEIWATVSIWRENRDRAQRH